MNDKKANNKEKIETQSKAKPYTNILITKTNDSPGNSYLAQEFLSSEVFPKQAYLPERLG